MEQLHCHLNHLSRDLLDEIFVRLDGSTLASAACTCSDLQGLARDQSLWKQLCHSTWPSTALNEARHLISPSAMDGFDKFYADSFPLILHDKDASDFPIKTHIISPSNFASFVDVYYSNKCILSSVLDGIPSAAEFSGDDETSDLMRWLLNCPFKLVLLDVDYDEGIEDGSELQSANNAYGYNQIEAPSIISIEQKGKSPNHCNELVEGLRLSWVLLDKKRGRAVNLSSWKPLLVKKIWTTDGDYTIHFGCIVPVDESVLPQKLAKCLILARCNIAEEGYLRWKEISMHFEDTTGAYINQGKSLIIMNQALYCLRSNKRHVVDKGYQRFVKQKQEMIRKKKFKETIADWLCLSIEIAIFITFGYYVLPI
ncbi:hypothetical protein DITRI_Ditri04bG0150600 [Diplodiscus trichospermus]